MAYTIGNHMLDMRGVYWVQDARLTTIKYLQIHVKKALANYAARNRGLPTHVIVFRSGASEGEYATVRDYLD